MKWVNELHSCQRKPFLYYYLFLILCLIMTCFSTSLLVLITSRIFTKIILPWGKKITHNLRNLHLDNCYCHLHSTKVRNLREQNYYFSDFASSNHHSSVRQYFQPKRVRIKRNVSGKKSEKNAFCKWGKNWKPIDK